MRRKPDSDRGKEPVSLGEGTVRRGTERALLVWLEDIGEERWIPRSCIHQDSEVWDADGAESVGEVIVRAWWAEKEGLG